jgi:thiamine pyrophosphate-dependent acetolactate synthase large subunit-like protein
MKRRPSRKSYLERLAPKAEGRIVVCCLGGASRLWAGIHPAPSNFLLTDYMGLAIPLALGMAVAQPKKQVIVMEGDGGLLMKMESLITAAAKAPPNLLVLTYFNGAYVATGGQPLPAAKGIDLEDFAKAARFPQTATVDSPDAFEAALDRMLDSGKLGYINLLTAPDTKADFKGDARPRPLDMRTDFTRWIKENC